LGYLIEKATTPQVLKGLKINWCAKLKFSTPIIIAVVVF